MIWTWFLNCQKFRMIFAQWLSWKGSCIAYLYRMVCIVICNTLVLYINARYTITRGSHYIRVVETYFTWSIIYLAIPILLSSLFAQSKMPFTYSCSCISSLLKHLSHGILMGFDYHFCISCSYMSIGTAPIIVSCKH